VLARQALKASGKVAGRTVGKLFPFGIGAVIGGVGSFTFGRDVVKAAHLAFPTTPTAFPDALLDFHKPEPGVGEPSRAMKALLAAGDGATGFGEAAWDKTSGARSAIKGAAAGGVAAVKETVIRSGATKAAVVRSRLRRKRDDDEASL